VLTCAHVISECQDVRVSFAQARRRDLIGLPGQVIFRGPWYGPGTTGDVAVIELEHDIDLTPARLVTIPDPSATLVAHGFPLDSGESGAILRVKLSSQDRIGEWSHIEADTGHSEFPRHGFSGAAAHEESTGRVVGMITDSSGSADRRTGRMLPIDAIRSYWEELDDLLDLKWLPANQRRELRQIVTDAGIDIPAHQLLMQTFPSIIRPRDFLSAWDAIRYVGEELMGQDRLGQFLVRLASHLTKERTRAELESWLRRTLPPVRAEEAISPSIIVRLEAKTKGGYFLTFSTWTDDGPGRPVHATSVDKNGLRAVVEDNLPLLMERVVGRDPIIEFVLPQSLLYEPVDEWYIDRANGISLRDYRMVLRDVARLRSQNSVIRDKWITRSKALRTGRRLPPEVISCHAPTAGQVYDWLMLRPDMCVLIHSSRPPISVLRKVLVSGVPVVLWPRIRCGESDHAMCSRHQMAAVLRFRVAAAPFDEIPGLVRQLRLEARERRGQPHCGRRLALLWDDPDRLPDPPTYTDGQDG
jgi:hypothetical protein